MGRGRNRIEKYWDIRDPRSGRYPRSGEPNPLPQGVRRAESATRVFKNRRWIFSVCVPNTAVPSMKTHNGFPHPVGRVRGSALSRVAFVNTRRNSRSRPWATAAARAAVATVSARFLSCVLFARSEWETLWTLSLSPPRSCSPRPDTKERALAVSTASSVRPRSPTRLLRFVRARASVRPCFAFRRFASRPCVVRRRACALAVARFRAFPAG